MKFTHLHLHNEYSVLDGIGKSKQYAELAKCSGQTHLAITNHGNVDGAVVHQKECRKLGIRPIIGCELYVVEDLASKVKKETRYHATLLVENQTGWQNLLKLLTISNVEGFYYRPRVDSKTLLNHLEGLVLLTGCSMSILNMPKAKKFIRKAIEIIGKDKIFLEVMPHIYDKQVEINLKCRKFSKLFGLQLVASNDCHYPTKESSMHQEVLLAVQSRKKWDDKDRWKFLFDGLYLKTGQEMHKTFLKQGCLTKTEIDQSISNTNKVAKLCERFKIKKQPVNLPAIRDFDTTGLGNIENEEIGFLYRQILKGLKKKLSSMQDEETKKIYEERTREEFGLIVKMNFQKYFLIVWDLIQWCHNNDVMVGPGRGSVGGSLVAYLLGITGVDPIKYNLVFFRFISPDRHDLPDIDLDFEDHKRYKIRQYLQQKYGEYNIAGLSTFATMKGKGVIRDVSRVFNIPLREVDSAAKAMDDTIKGNKQVKESFETIPECMRFKSKYPKVVEIAEALEGQIRGAGQHAAGIVISSRDLREGFNCNLAIRKKVVVANWDKDDAEHMGLMKLDVLGLSALSVLNETKKMIMINHGVDIDFGSIDLADKKVFDQINRGNTIGAFQIGTPGLTKFCIELGIDNFELIASATALYRPGPLHSGMAEKFSKRKRGEIKVEKIHPIYDKITEDTFGVIVYQEQVMRVINELSGIPMNICNDIRKVMAKSKGAQALNKFMKQFVEGCSKNKTVDKAKAKSIWKTISTFGAYGFNRSHSVEYSMITYWDMWFKTYYPAEFLACSLTFNKKEQVPQFIRESKKIKLSLKLPKVGVSRASEWIADKDGNLFAPFNSMNGIGPATAKILAESKPKIKNNMGFFKTTTRQTAIKGVSEAVMKNLQDIYAFDIDKDITPQERMKFKGLFSF